MLTLSHHQKIKNFQILPVSIGVILLILFSAGFSLNAVFKLKTNQTAEQYMSDFPGSRREMLKLFPGRLFWKWGGACFLAGMWEWGPCRTGPYGSNLGVSCVS